MRQPITLVGGVLLALATPAAAQTRGGVLDADGPAARRLRELFEAVESGSTARIRAFVRAAYSPEALRRTSEEQLVQAYARLHDRSRGLEADSLRATPTEVAVLFRAKLTGLYEAVSIRVEPEPPHRIVGDASFSISRAKHPLSSATASDADRVREIDRLARILADADVFSGVVLVAKDDSILYLRALGDADRERRIPLRRGTRFGLASITKTFVSVAIAQLAEQGKLSWDDPLGKHLPDFPIASARENVRVKHLVTHTSGLRELRSAPERPTALDDYVSYVAATQTDSLLYRPGTRWVYTNSNYVLLGKIIERVSGRPYHEYIRERIFQPAAMQHADFDRPGRPKEARLAVAYGRQYTDSGVRVTTDTSPSESTAPYPAPYSAAYGNAPDLIQFAWALRSGRILRPETFELLVSPKPEAGNWGYGFDILDAERGLVGHGGSWIGVSNSLDLFTRSGYTAVILSNYTAGRSPLREAIWGVLP